MLDINKIVQHNLPEANYFKEEHPKTMIFVHHTAGNSNPLAVIDDWKNRTDHVATAFIIGGKPKAGEAKYKDGDIVQGFSSKCWAYHLGLKTEVFKKFNVPYQSLDKISIGIEMCNWGYLTKQADGTFRNYVNGIVLKEEVVELEAEYRGYKYYHKYTDAQLASLKDLLIYLCDKYNIPKTFNGNMFDVNADALKGNAGIWTHVSVRYDKFDCPSQPNLINVLKNLKA